LESPWQLNFDLKARLWRSGRRRVGQSEAKRIEKRARAPHNET